MLGYLMPLLPYASELLHRGHCVTIFMTRITSIVKRSGSAALAPVNLSLTQVKIYAGVELSLKASNHTTAYPKTSPTSLSRICFAVDAAESWGPCCGSISQPSIDQSMGGISRGADKLKMDSLVRLIL
jgi:hypothetical protein